MSDILGKGSVIEEISQGDAEQFDGNFEQSHFSDPEFNAACVNEAFPSIYGYLIRHSKKPRKNFIDAGAGGGDFLFKLKEAFDSDNEVRRVLTGNGIDKSSLSLVATDIDPHKLVEGRRRRAEEEMYGMQINYFASRIEALHTIEELGFNNPSVILQRSVLQYFVGKDYSPLDPSTWPENGYTQEQHDLLWYYLQHLYTNHIEPGSMIIMIDSTGDQIGLRRFEYLLANITATDESHYKKLHYVSPPDISNLINSVNDRGKREKSDNMMKLYRQPAYINGNFGRRSILNLWQRYGNGREFGDFKNQVLSAYSESESLFEGDTGMITRTDDDLIIDIKYLMAILQVNRRRK